MIPFSCNISFISSRNWSSVSMLLLVELKGARMIDLVSAFLRMLFSLVSSIASMKSSLVSSPVLRLYLAVSL